MAKCNNYLPGYEVYEEIFLRSPQKSQRLQKIIAGRPRICCAATERSRSTANSMRLFLSVSTWASPTGTTESGHCCATTDQGAAKPAMTKRCI
ncbi:hypothetical protein J6590_080809 [Homalodisca vitripennis]|nr:hypothetical protein J6590_080809 [Homalodisca vitripennis]